MGKHRANRASSDEVPPRDMVNPVDDADERVGRQVGLAHHVECKLKCRNLLGAQVCAYVGFLIVYISACTSRCYYLQVVDVSWYWSRYFLPTSTDLIYNPENLEQ